MVRLDQFKSMSIDNIEPCQMPQNHKGESQIPKATVPIFLDDDLFDSLDLSGLPASGAQIYVCERCADIFIRGRQEIKGQE